MFVNCLILLLYFIVRYLTFIILNILLHFSSIMEHNTSFLTYEVFVMLISSDYRLNSMIISFYFLIFIFGYFLISTHIHYFTTIINPIYFISLSILIKTQNIIILIAVFIDNFIKSLIKIIHFEEN